jgi:hypothetical protein
MKYLKKFENIKKTYNKGDLVLLNYKSDTEFLLPFAKIIKRVNLKWNQHPIDRYYVEILFPNTKHWSYDKLDDIHAKYIVEYDIIQKTTLKEIEDFKMKIDTKKYNI